MVPCGFCCEAKVPIMCVDSSMRPGGNVGGASATTLGCSFGGVMVGVSGVICGGVGGGVTVGRSVAARRCCRVSVLLMATVGGKAGVANAIGVFGFATLGGDTYGAWFAGAGFGSAW